MLNNDGVRGIWNGPNGLADQPPNALEVGKNIVIRNKNKVEPRRGHRNTVNDTGLKTEAIFFDKDGNGLLLNRPVLGGAYSLQKDVNGSVSSIPLGDRINGGNPLTPPDLNKLASKSLNYNSRVYFTTAEGVKVFENNTIYSAGLPEGTTPVFITPNGAGGFVPASGGSVAYVHTWCRRNVDNEVLEGPPSPRYVFTNNIASPQNTFVQYRIPEIIDTSYFIRVYRTEAVEPGVDPSEEYFLVKESYITPTENTNRIFEYQDNTPDDLLVVPAYFSNSQSLPIKYRPPVCKDITSFDGRLWYANTTIEQQLLFSIVGVDYENLGTGGVKSGDLIRIYSDNGSVYEFLARILGEPDVPGFDSFYLSDNASPSIRIKETVDSLVNAINNKQQGVLSLMPYIAYRVEGDDPGVIVIKAKHLYSPRFYVTVSDGQRAYVPNLPLDSSTSPEKERVASTNVAATNRLYFSELREPEAVSRTSFVEVGASNVVIHRVKTLGPFIYVFTDKGIYVISAGSNGNYFPEEFDLTTRILCPDSLVELENSLYLLSNKGLVRVSSSGVTIVSSNIERTVSSLNLNGYLTRNPGKIFAFSYGSERQYVLCVPEYIGQLAVYSDNDWTPQPVTAYVYNLDNLSDTYTTWEFPRNCAAVSPKTDTIYSVITVDNKRTIYNERKTLTNRDYCDDEQFSLAVNEDPEALGTQGHVRLGILRSTLGNFVPEVGDLIAYEGTVSGLFRSYLVTNVEIVDINTIRLTLDPSSQELLAAFPNDSVGLNYTISIFKSYECIVKWVPNYAGEPALQKTFDSFHIFFGDTTFYQARLGFATESMPMNEDVTVEWMVGPNAIRPPDLYFGLLTRWGKFNAPKNKRRNIPVTHSQGNYFIPQFKIREACSLWSLLGYSVNITATSEINSA